VQRDSGQEFLIDSSQFPPPAHPRAVDDGLVGPIRTEVERECAVGCGKPIARLIGHLAAEDRAISNVIRTCWRWTMPQKLNARFAVEKQQ